MDRFGIPIDKGMAFFILFILFTPFITCAQRVNIGEKTIAYTDSSRNRPVKVEVWYPTNQQDSSGAGKTDLPFVLDPTIRDATFVDQKLPMIILSHGSGGNRYSLAWLAISLAKQGYLVAAPDHWGGTYGNMIPEYYIRYWERPLDVSYLLTRFLNDSSISPFVDKEKIGVIGFSFGGFTALSLAGADIDCNILKQNAKTKQGKKEFNIPELGDLTRIIDTMSCYRQKSSFKDDRIKAFVALAPGLGLGYNDVSQFTSVNSPVLIIAAGKADRIAPLNTNAQRYKNFMPLAKLIVLNDETGHYIFLNEGDPALKKEAVQLFTDHAKINRKELHNQIAGEVLSFLKQNLFK